MSRTPFVVLAAATFLGLACSNKPEAAPVTTTRTKDAPSWIDNPAVPDGLGETGYAQANPLNDRGMQTQAAMMDGRVKLAAMVKVRVQNMFSSLNQQLTSAGTGTDKKKPIRSDVMQRMIENVTRNVVDEVLQGSMRRATWVDANGDMYIHMVMPKDATDRVLRQQAAQEVRKEIAQGEKSLESALDKLDAALAAS